MYYHGTSTELKIGHKLLPPDITGKIQEKGRKKNTNKVFFTKDKNSAKIYSGRSLQKFGGEKIIYRVIPMGDIEILNENEGTSVYCCDWAFVEEVK